MKKILSILFSLILIATSFVQCFATVTYDIDPYTGERIGSDDAADDTVTQKRLSSICYYDISSRQFVYTTSQNVDNKLVTNIYDGEITNNVVTIDAATVANIVVYKDGAEVSSDNGYYNLESAGSYVVRDTSEDEVLFSFTIVGSTVGSLGTYTVPNLFFITKVLVDDQQVSSPSYSVDLSQEGVYKIYYKSTSLNLSREIMFYVDNTAPSLEISGVEDGIARGPVTFGATEDGSSVRIYRNGTEITYSDTLETPGTYHIVYTDNAGNSVTYDFTIRVYLDLNASLVVAAVAAVVIGVIGYMIYLRKHLRTF